MKLVSRIEDVPAQGTGNLVAIGKWDGVHLGHQTIVRELVAEARRTGGQAVVVGFHPLPMAVLCPDQAPPALQTLAERAEVLAGLGVDVYLALPFTREFASMEPEAFVQDVLLGQLRARQVMVGFNNTFGRGGRGNAETLTRMLGPLGVPVRVFPPVTLEGQAVSSTEIRRFLASGEVEQAARFLGRPFSVDGVVVSGDRRGQQLGYPTANLQVPEGRQLPACGVYVARVTVLEQPSFGDVLPCTVTVRSGPSYGAMLNLGMRPTFQGKDLRIEAHLLDFRGDLYGKELRVEFLTRLRGEKAFPDADALRQQLAADEAAARAWLEAHGI
ncbi:MAG TPA: bifunctional riboflavin kinase/FAD synthetase [Symbiobacteriaceae bacterium]